MRRSGALPLVVTVMIAVGWLAYTLTVGGRSPQLGLDLQGGTSVVLGGKEGQTASSGQLDQAISIIRRRDESLRGAATGVTREGQVHDVSTPYRQHAQSDL